MKLPVFIFLILFACVSYPASSQKSTTPNVILIFLDDMGNGDLGVTGALEYQTPAIDKMASEGVRFTNFLSAQGVCSASRAGLLTGCYPNRIGISGALFPNSNVGINPEETTMAELFKQKGYATAIVGKWHLGDATLHHPGATYLQWRWHNPFVSFGHGCFFRIYSHVAIRK